jgi:hypothetical protein
MKNQVLSVPWLQVFPLSICLKYSLVVVDPIGRIFWISRSTSHDELLYSYLSVS